VDIEVLEFMYGNVTVPSTKKQHGSNKFTVTHMQNTAINSSAPRQAKNGSMSLNLKHALLTNTTETVKL
jgi:hypothetical protein